MKTVKEIRKILELKREFFGGDTTEYDAYNLIDDVIRMIVKKIHCDNYVEDIVNILLEDTNFTEEFSYVFGECLCHVINTDKALNAWKNSED